MDQPNLETKGFRTDSTGEILIKDADALLRKVGPLLYQKGMEWTLRCAPFVGPPDTKLTGHTFKTFPIPTSLSPEDTRKDNELNIASSTDYGHGRDIDRSVITISMGRLD